MSAQHKTFDIEVVERRENGGKIRISTNSLDRDRDRVMPRGGRIENYLKNPVVQYGHVYRDPWATIGRTNSLEIFDTYIDADFDLRPAANEYDPQNIVILLWNGGWVRTASIGFNPYTAKANAEGGYDFVDWELLEWSLVPVPANQDALRLMAKALGAGDGQPTPAKPTPTSKDASQLFVDHLAEALTRLDTGRETLQVASTMPTTSAEERQTAIEKTWEALEAIGNARSHAYIGIETLAMEDSSWYYRAGEGETKTGKRGRVLSAANEQRIRDALQALQDVLAAVEGDDGEGDKTASTTNTEFPEADTGALSAALADYFSALKSNFGA
jgi:hypothetical protein